MNIKDKRHHLRQYAKTLKLCITCMRRDTATNKNTCQRCADVNKRAQDKKRHTPGRCSRCGRVNHHPNKKTCDKCREYQNKYNDQNPHHPKPTKLEGAKII